MFGKYSIEFQINHPKSEYIFSSTYHFKSIKIWAYREFKF